MLEYLRGRRIGNDYDSRYSYGTGSVVDQGTPQRKSSRTKRLAEGAIAGAGIYALVNRFRRRSSAGREDRPEVVGSRRHSRHSGSYVEDEKYSDYSRDSRGGIWEDRLFKIAAPLGLAGAAAWFARRRHRDRSSDQGDYRPPLGGQVPTNSGHDGQGHPPPGGPIPLNQPLPTNQHPLNQLPPSGLPLPGQRPPSHRHSSLTYSESSYDSASNQRRTGHGFRDGLATLGALGLARSIWNRRKERKEDRRLADEQESRIHDQHFTGDGRPPRHRPPIGAESTLSGDTGSSIGHLHPHTAHGIPPIPAGTLPGGATVAGANAFPGGGRNTVEELPLGGVARNGHVAMPEMPPERPELFHENSSGSEVFIGSDGRNHWRHHAGRDAAAAGLAGAAAGGIAAHEIGNRRRSRDPHESPLSTAEAGSSRRDRQDRRASASGEDSGGTPVSVKVKMHQDGRHVTLRRLPEEEAAAEREARRRSREQAGRHRADSASSLSGTDGSTQRFRRNQTLERQNAEAMRIESERLREARAQAQAQSNPNAPPNVPAPPPIPETPPSALRPGQGPPISSVGSPGTYDGNTTEASADWADNRRRRRAERSQARQAKEAKKVEFE